MKRLILQPVLVLLCGSLIAQNVQFIPFGQTREEVLTFLESRDYIVRINTDQKDELCAIGENYFLEYKFKENKLYQISSNKYYPKTKLAKPCIEHALDYFRMNKGEISLVNNQTKDQYWMSVHEGRLFELELTSYDDFVKLSLHSTSRFHGPRQNTEEKIIAMTYGNR